MWFAKDKERLKHRPLYASKELGGRGEGQYTRVELPDGRRVPASHADAVAGRPFRLDNMTSARVREARTGYYPVDIDGRSILPRAGEWKTHQEGMRKLAWAGRLQLVGNTVTYVRYIDDFPAFPYNNFWKDAAGTSFEQSILDNLAKAGIQNGRRNERITFATLDVYPAQYLQAVGERFADEEDSTAPSRVGIAIGPQYGTVSPAYIKAAAREAIKTGDIDLVAVLGFAFDAQATEVTEADGVTVTLTDEGFATVAGERRLGRIPVLLVRMNVDLLMGEDLKKSGSGNLFTVFGEPDIDLVDADDGRLVVRINGVDVFDATTGDVRSNDTSKIALWMLDTSYNEESFFVRHCYFTGGNDPYKRLRSALKSDIDAEAWESLYRTESRPFDRPETGEIAVKVINDYGDEVMKASEV